MRTILKLQMKHIFMSIVFSVFLVTTSACSNDDEPDNRIEVTYEAVVGPVTNSITNISYTDANGDVVTVPADSDDFEILEGNLHWKKTIRVNAPFNASLSAIFHHEGTSTAFGALFIDRDDEQVSEEFSTLNAGMSIPLSASAAITEQ